MDSTAGVVEPNDRWMAWGGLVFLLLFVVIEVLAGGDTAEGASGESVVKAYLDSGDARRAGAFLVAPSAASLLLFVACFRSVVGPAAGAGRRLLQYGAIVYATALASGAVLELGMVSAAAEGQPAVAETLNVLNQQAWIPTAVGVGVLLIGAFLSVRRTRVLPGWMGWIALVLGVVSLIAWGGYAGFMLGPVWIAVAGVMLATRRAAAVAA